jgi:hypothetical protein
MAVEKPVLTTVAMAVLLLAQVPPPVPSLRGMLWPWHTLDGPVMAGGMGLTMTVLLAIHPVVCV